MTITGSGCTDPAPGPHDYAEGTLVPITATPDAGWQFDGWSGDVANAGSPATTTTVDADKTITANFSQIATPTPTPTATPTVYTLTMSVSGSGSTDPAIGPHDFVEGTVVAISATPDPGWQFDSWTGDVASAGSAMTTTTMDADKTITANFSQLATPTPTPEHCEADFYVWPESCVSPGCDGPLMVFFTDISEGAVTGRSWDLNGDGQEDSAAEEASYYYSENHAYKVTLTVTWMGGCTDTEVKYINIFGCGG